MSIPQGLEHSRHVRLIEAATRAPSSHNTQPWLFRLRDGAIDLLADRSRALPVNDPDDRELTLSCGAAICNLRAAAASEGLSSEVELTPERGDVDLLARIHLRRGPPEADLAVLHSAIDQRYSTREAFDPLPVSDALLSDLAAAAAAEGAVLRALEGEERRAVASLVAEGDRMQFRDERWRRELAGWMHPLRSGDGLPGSRAVVPLSRFVVRHFDLGDRIAVDDERLALDAPLLAILTTEGDGIDQWLRAGQALERALLHAAAQGFQAGYLNQPCQVPALRPLLADVAARGAKPQLILRIGIPKVRELRSSRRPAADVILQAAA